MTNPIEKELRRLLNPTTKKIITEYCSRRAKVAEAQLMECSIEQVQYYRGFVHGCKDIVMGLEVLSRKDKKEPQQ